MLSEPIEITHKAIDMTDSGEPKTEVVENADGNKTIMPVLGNRTTKDVYTQDSQDNYCHTQQKTTTTQNNTVQQSR